MKMDSYSVLEREQLAQLARFRRIATGLLLMMAVVFVVAKRLEVAYPWLALVRAFAEAAMVGALADWFAVTALFKHPLGLPIPHTAIIRRNKDRIGASIANFLEHNFMTREVISEELAEVDFAAALASWLEAPGNGRRLAHQLAGTIPALLRMMEDKDVGHFLQQRVSATLQEVRFAPLLGGLLAILKAGGQHQRVFDHVIELAADALDRNQPYIRQKIHDSSPRWLPKSIDEKFFVRLVDELNNILDEMREEDSEWRGRFEFAFENFIEQLKTSPDYEARIDRWIREMLAQNEFRGYITQIWQDIKARLLQDVEAEDSKTVARLEQALVALARALEQDRVVSDKLNRWLRGFATETIVHRRGEIAQLVERVIRKWDGETIARKVELHVGKDLQYIRINGTLVGGMVGLVLHLVALALG
ncbi:DUF445 domain-containing protein [Janthinobacterium sp. 17J80-10]|uniref:DUF445 domain-containing protein n=1 Tax=Janthinobacterium sp. 17J80-10 TaxID=2497863 RepID=UPI001F505BA4|nr:DUF445 domain-containing protein [Janthinobacterium sp. 17J80-10]